jgi:hypothetical protein
MEFLEHVAYYESRRAGLGNRFVAAFESTMVLICAAPQRDKIEYPPDVRRHRLAGFPYNVLYRQSGMDVEILAVAPHRRRPDYWLERQ